MNVLPIPLPWLESSIVIALIGALIVSRLRDPLQAWRVGLGFAAATFVCTLLACAGFYACRETATDAHWSFESALLGKQFFGIDELNAPLLALVGLLHFLTALATGRTKMRRFSMSWSLTAAAIRLAMFGCIAPWMLIGLLALETLPPYFELVNWNKPTRIYTLHMGLFVFLLVAGWALVDPAGDPRTQTGWATLPLLAAVLVRCGTIPAHCWVTDWFEHASFGNALLYVTPLTGVYAAVRLVLPIAPDWVLQSMGTVSLITAVYAAGMALVQRDARRFFAYLYITHAALVLVGLEIHTAISLTGALALWLSVSLSLTGFGLTLRALEARFGHMTIGDFRGLYDHSPALAVCFILTGLATVGFPGTLGFVATELLVDGAVQASPYIGFAVALVAALNGIAVVGAYFRLFTGTRHLSSIALNIGPRERLAVLTLAALLLGGGLFPQLQISSRHRAAADILKRRHDLDTTQSDELQEHAEPVKQKTDGAFRS